MEFTAIDFETANASRDSACAIGLVTVKDGRIIDEYYKLIKPKYIYFNPENTEVNGITQEMIMNEPDFEQLWPEIFPRLQNGQVTAHFAKFDINVLRSTLNSYYLPFPTFDYICSWLLSKKAFPTLGHYRLDYVARYLGFTFRHHHALEDARACAYIMSEIIKRTPAPIQDFRQLAESYGLSCGHMQRGRIDACVIRENAGEAMPTLF